MHVRKRLTLLLIPLLAIAGLAHGDEIVKVVPDVGLDRATLTSFLDNYLPKAMASRHIPGLAITVVKDGKPLLTKGYGVADIDTKRPVDPHKTLFDVQSVSKLVVSVAVMIAAEHGAVDLDTDVNQYLKDLQVPDTWPAPITLASLMTHTSGLEDRGIGISARTPAQVTPLGQYLARTLTRRVAPPFTNLLYSDQGMSLAAYTVQSATGVPYKTFVQRNIFEPLGMMRTFYFDAPAAFRDDRASAYSWESGKLVKIPHYYYNIWPTSSLWTTAADMSRFIAMQLQGGELDGNRILSEADVNTLHTRHFSYDPRMPGVCYDFFEHFENGQRLLIHSGGGSGFVSELMLMPSQHIGYFFSYNGYDGSLIGAFRSAFLDKFFPAAEGQVVPIHMTTSRLDSFDGWYWSTRYDRRGIGKLSSLVDGYLHVTTGAGGLVIGGRSFAPLSDKVFVNQDDDLLHYTAFRRTSDGKVTAMLPADSEAPYERVSPFYSQPVQLALVALGALSLIIVLLYLVVSAFRTGLGNVFADWTRDYFFVMATANLACLALLVVQLISSSTPSGAIAFELGMSQGMKALLVTITVFAAMALASPVVALGAWLRGERRWGSIAFVAGLFAVGYVWFLNTWNILSVPKL